MRTIPLVRAVVVHKAAKIRLKTTRTCLVYALIARESEGFGVHAGHTEKNPEEEYREHLEG